VKSPKQLRGALRTPSIKSCAGSKTRGKEKIQDAIDWRKRCHRKNVESYKATILMYMKKAHLGRYIVHPMVSTLLIISLPTSPFPVRVTINFGTPDCISHPSAQVLCFIIGSLTLRTMRWRLLVLFGDWSTGWVSSRSHRHKQRDTFFTHSQKTPAARCHFTLINTVQKLSKTWITMTTSLNEYKPSYDIPYTSSNVFKLNPDIF
jgi:acyl dehydratase